MRSYRRPSLVTAQCCIKPNPLIRANTQSPRTENPQLRVTIRGDPLIQDKLGRPSACGRGPRQNSPLSRAGAFLGENCGTARCRRGNRLSSGARIRQKPQRNRARKSLRCGSRLSGFPSAKNICFWPNWCKTKLSSRHSDSHAHSACVRLQSTQTEPRCRAKELPIVIRGYA